MITGKRGGLTYRRCVDLPATPAELAERLDTVDYLADDGVATAAFLALRMGRPLFVEGEAGVGKTALAHALAEVLDAPLIRLQCYEGLDAAQALYDWDFPRQLLHLRTAEAAGITDAERLEHELYDRRFLIARPLLQAIETLPSVLLVDEIDRADDEFEAFLLEVLSEAAITVPELGRLVAETIDWASALGRLGVTELDERSVEATLGTVLKYREDHDRVEQHGIADIVKQALAHGSA